MHKIDYRIQWGFESKRTDILKQGEERGDGI